MTKTPPTRNPGRTRGGVRRLDADAASDETFRLRSQALGDPTRHAIYARSP